MAVDFRRYRIRSVNLRFVWHRSYSIEKMIDMDAMVQHPDLIGGFNRLDSTIIKAGNGQVIAKEGADGLLGLGIIHPDYPNGLGVVIKIAHGWNAQATWYVARAVLGVLDMIFLQALRVAPSEGLVSGIVPEQYLSKLEEVKPGMNGIPTGIHTTIDGCSIRWGDCNKNNRVKSIS